MMAVSFWESGALVKALLIVAPFVLLSLWAIWHGMRHSFATPQERLLWVCFAVFVPIIGGVAYLFFGRKRAKGKLW